MKKKISNIQFITQDVNGLSHLQQIELALKGGCSWVQLRLKDKAPSEVLEIATQARKLTSEFGAVLIINDFYEVAKLVKADGIHLGKNDANPTEVRSYLGDQFIIGATANTFEDIQNLVQQPIDYLGVGPFKFTTTKKNLSPILGLNGYQQIVTQCKDANTEVPMVAIGSVVAADIPALLNTGMFGIAVSSAISKSGNPTEATKLLLKIIQENQPSPIQISETLINKL